MASNIKLDLAGLSETVSSTLVVINDLQSEAESAYCDMASLFSASCGDEADALRELMETEKYVVKELTDTLKSFILSIQFAANELSNMDATGARNM